MPNLGSPREYIEPRSLQWKDAAATRMGAALHAACAERHATIVLGAFGCGAFRNPPDEVAYPLLPPPPNPVLTPSAPPPNQPSPPPSPLLAPS